MRTLSGRSGIMAATCLVLVLPRLAASQGAIPAADRQIAAAVLPAPAEMRDGATVWGYAPDGKFVTLRRGTNDMVCLASNPNAPSFHVACYHKSLEPFMARGRELRAAGITAVDSARYAEIDAKKLPMPTTPAALFSLTGQPTSLDPATGAVTGARQLYVVYLPFATAEQVGLSAKPVEGAPWVMYPGTPKAHIMFTPKM